MADLFAEAGEPARRRGPRTLLSDQEIFVRREDFANVFSALWGETGWQLQKCRSENDVLMALSPLNQVPFIRERASMFFYESREAVSAANPRKLRRELDSVRQSRQSVDRIKEDAFERANRIDAVLAQFPNNRRQIKKERKRLWEGASGLKQKWLELSRRQKGLEDQLRQTEAVFARQQVLNFCRMGRYELTPLHLAGAVAGLPYMRWRQSMRRTIDQPSAFENGLDFQVFKAIRFVVENANRKSAKTLITEFRETIPQLPSRHRAAKLELAEKWYYLRSAIGRAFRAKLPPRALPFEIAKHYFKQFRTPRTQAKLIVAERARLRLPRMNRGTD